MEVVCVKNDPTRSIFTSSISEAFYLINMIRTLGHLFSWVLLLVPVFSEAVSAQSDHVPPLFIEGYPGNVSYKAGEELSLHISCSSTKYSIEIARLGASREVVWSKKDFVGQSHPVPENSSSHGCQWPAAAKITIPDSWRSGYYEVSFRTSDSGGKYAYRGARSAESTCFFVIRAQHPGSTSKILLQLSTNTYNAYNNWGGTSLYAYNGRANIQGHRVSFHRPPTSQFKNWEFPFATWAESNGIALEYAANSDLEYHPEILKAYRLVLSVGHDEYWSAPMRDHLESYIGSGGNVAFLSGNTCCWQIRSEDSGSAFVCWKQRYVMDPLFPSGDHRLLSTLWSHHLVERPENRLTGVGFLFGGYHKSHGQFMDGSGAYTVHRPDHWIFEGTGLKGGMEFGGKDSIVGYECDGCEFEIKDGLPVPTHRDGTPEGFLILGSAPARWHPDDAFFYERFDQRRIGAAILGLYQRGGTVITAGSTDWAHGLKGKDPMVERITMNILERLGK